MLIFPPVGFIPPIFYKYKFDYILKRIIMRKFMNERNKINDIIFLFAQKFMKISKVSVSECTVRRFKEKKIRN